MAGHSPERGCSESRTPRTRDQEQRERSQQRGLLASGPAARCRGPTCRNHSPVQTGRTAPSLLLCHLRPTTRASLRSLPARSQPALRPDEGTCGRDRWRRRRRRERHSPPAPRRAHLSPLTSDSVMCNPTVEIFFYAKKIKKPNKNTVTGTTGCTHGQASTCHLPLAPGGHAALPAASRRVAGARQRAAGQREDCPGQGQPRPRPESTRGLPFLPPSKGPSCGSLRSNTAVRACRSRSPVSDSLCVLWI